MLFKQWKCPTNASSWTCYLGYSQSTSRPLNLYSLSSSMASYTNWFIRYTLDVSSLNGVDPNAHPPIASRICNRVIYSIHKLCVFIIHWISSQGSWQGVVLHLGGSVVGWQILAVKNQMLRKSHRALDCGTMFGTILKMDNEWNVWALCSES
jgi:hypothetical protein